MTTSFFHDPGERPDTSKAHREDIISGQVDRWDAVDAEMDAEVPSVPVQRRNGRDGIPGPHERENATEAASEIPGQIDIFGAVHPGGESIAFGSGIACRTLEVVRTHSGTTSGTEPEVTP